ncbi:hypothetical protein [Candidatus Nitrosotenuis uzonensis]|uniref:Uncharacterized protein n=1 Tax=Candidatus Nitrosotenuis uzonensis TaxID=1407055 RepID=A0A812EYX9_9ARCH|nr:hypothetical protein [Candidatus Nitrosotenuis uzonensis]CAE6500907.1 exported hypothetical protein [Candidatus Nitrosotenuis uzonensis]
MKKMIVMTLLTVAVFSLTVALTVDSIQYADAAKFEGSSGKVSPKSYGSANKNLVCGDKLCSDLAKSG